MHSFGDPVTGDSPIYERILSLALYFPKSWLHFWW